MGLVQETTAHNRWVDMRTRAGYQSDQALERALGVSAGRIWHWIVQGREPNLYTLRQLKQLLGVSLDVLDETIVSWRAEVQRNRSGATD